MFKFGENYTREDVAEIIGYPVEKRGGGQWMTGGTKFNDAYYIFANVGLPGRTGHDYPNRWLGNELILTGRTGSNLQQRTIQEMIGGDFAVHIFWRGSERAQFTYAGQGDAIEASNTTPVEIVWAFPERIGKTETQDPALGAGAARQRRGPPPTRGDRIAVYADGPTYLYLMELLGASTGNCERMMSDARLVKVGISSDVKRRQNELNGGFPPGLKLRWEIIGMLEFPNGKSAFEAEGRRLEALRLRRLWIGGEFGVVSSEEIDWLQSVH